MNSDYPDILQHSAVYKRTFVLGNLITLRQVGIKITFPVKVGILGDISAYRQTQFNNRINCLFIYSRQRSGVPQANRANIHVRLFFVEIVKTGTEHLCPRLQLRVNL